MGSRTSSASAEGPSATAASSRPRSSETTSFMRTLTAPVDGHQRLAVDDHEAVLAGLDGARQLLDVALVVAQEAALHELVVALAQRLVDAEGGVQRQGRQTLGSAQPLRPRRDGRRLASEGGSPVAGCGMSVHQSSDLGAGGARLELTPWPNPASSDLPTRSRATGHATPWQRMDAAATALHCRWPSLRRCWWPCSAAIAWALLKGILEFPGVLAVAVVGGWAIGALLWQVRASPVLAAVIARPGLAGRAAC